MSKCWTDSITSFIYSADWMFTLLVSWLCDFRAAVGKSVKNSKSYIIQSYFQVRAPTSTKASSSVHKVVHVSACKFVMARF